MSERTYLERLKTEQEILRKEISKLEEAFDKLQGLDMNDDNEFVEMIQRSIKAIIKKHGESKAKLENLNMAYRNEYNAYLDARWSQKESDHYRGM